jgi:hypothetical protein
MMPKLRTDSQIITQPRRVNGTKGLGSACWFRRDPNRLWLMKMTGNGARTRCLGRTASREKVGCLV